MAELSENELRSQRAAERSCGSCSLCCTVLRVDDLSKLAGRDCAHQGPRGCGIYQTRPNICRGYRCLWLQGGLEDDQRPDLIGGVVDLQAAGLNIGLVIHEARPGAFDASPSLHAIAERYRTSMPVRILDTGDVLDPDHPFRVLHADGIEHLVEGDRLTIFRNGKRIGDRRQPFAERLLRRATQWWQRRKLGGHAE
jgi:hypothetical protein